MRPTKLGEKNRLFSGGAEAGFGNRLLYTLMRNCRVNDTDPEIYVAEVARRMPERPTDQQAAALTLAAMIDEVASTLAVSTILTSACA